MPVMDSEYCGVACNINVIEQESNEEDYVDADMLECLTTSLQCDDC